MNILRSLEQERAGFAYNVLNSVVSLRGKEESKGRINRLIELVIKEKDKISEEMHESLKIKKAGEPEKVPFDIRYQQNLEKKLSSYINKSNSQILTNGLGNTMAFYISKIKYHPKDLSAKIDKFKSKPQDKDAKKVFKDSLPLIP